MIIAVTGSTGLLAARLIDALEADGHSVRRVVRRSDIAIRSDGGDEIRWDPAAGTIDAAAFSDVDAVVHLAGESVAAHRWTAAVKREIRDSRVRGTTLLCETLAGLASKPAVLVSASAVGYYGDRGDERLDESSPPGSGFLADVCQEWEARDARRARCRHPRRQPADRRRAQPQGRRAGKMLTPFKLGVGGVHRQRPAVFQLDHAR